MKIDEFTIRNIVREEILKKNSVISEQETIEDEPEFDTSMSDDEEPELIADEPEFDTGSSSSSSGGGGSGGCRRPDVGRMQRIFMGEEGAAEDGAKTPNLRYEDDCIWGQYTQAAWVKFLKHYLTDAEHLRVGERADGSDIQWAAEGASAASDIIEDKSYQGTPGGALAFVRDLIARGVSEEEEEEEPDTGEASPDTDEIEADEAEAEASTDAMGMDPEDVPDESPSASEDSESSSSNFLSIPVQDNEGQLAFTIFVPARSISTDAASRYRDGIAGMFLNDFVIDFTQGSARSSVTQGMEDRFIISWGQYDGMIADPESSSRSAYANIEYPFSEVTGLKFEDTFPFRRVPDDDPFKVVVKCLEAERRALRRQSAEIKSQWEGSVLGGALLGVIDSGSARRNYQRLIITLSDGTERILVRPHPRNSAIMDPEWRSLLDQKYQTCITRTQRRGRRGDTGADRSDGIDWSAF